LVCKILVLVLCARKNASNFHDWCVQNLMILDKWN
jgi:hypothetical protein